MSSQIRRLLTKTSPNTLEEVAQKFYRIRAQKQGRRIRFPKELWQEVFDLTTAIFGLGRARKLGLGSYPVNGYDRRD